MAAEGICSTDRKDARVGCDDSSLQRRLFTTRPLPAAARKAADRAAKATLAMDNRAATVWAARSVRSVDEVTPLTHVGPPGAVHCGRMF